MQFRPLIYANSAAGKSFYTARTMKTQTIIDLFSTLSEDDRTDVLRRLERITPKKKLTARQRALGVLFESANVDDYLNRIIAKNDRGVPICPRCNSRNTRKAGSAYGKARYVCKHCGRSFGASTGSVMFNTRKSLEQWRRYLYELKNYHSLRKSRVLSDVADPISLSTAFNWRHKILDASIKQDDIAVLAGIVQADETFFRLSFKGAKNPAKVPKDFRKTFKSDEKQKVHVVVPSAVTKEAGLAKIGDLSLLAAGSLSAVVNTLYEHIKTDSFLVTDGAPLYKTFAQLRNLSHVVVESEYKKNGEFDINRVNQLHSALKGLINYKYRGVSTKYLNNYLHLYCTRGATPEETAKYAFARGRKRTDEVANREAIPLPSIVKQQKV